MALDLNIYGWIQKSHRQLFPLFFSPEKFSEDITVVGSVHAGGVAKTPFVMALVKAALKSGRNVGVVSRGFRGTYGRGPLWVSDGHGPLVPPLVSGDEPWLIAWRYPEVKVVVCPDRVQGIRCLLDFGVEQVISDDGFQHLRLEPTRSLVLLPSDPDPRDKRLLPFGRLREPLKALTFATELWTEKSSKAKWKTILDAQSIATPLQTYRREWTEVLHRQKTISLADFKTAAKAPVYVTCGLGRPNGFQLQCEEFFAHKVRPLLYRDHQRIPWTDLESIREGSIVMTEKDWVKLHEFWNAQDKPAWLKHCFVVREAIEKGD